MKASIHELWLAGKTVKQITAALGLKYNAVYMVLLRLGVGQNEIHVRHQEDRVRRKKLRRSADLMFKQELRELRRAYRELRA